MHTHVQKFAHIAAHIRLPLVWHSRVANKNCLVYLQFYFVCALLICFVFVKIFLSTIKAAKNRIEYEIPKVELYNKSKIHFLGQISRLGMTTATTTTATKTFTQNVNAFFSTVAGNRHE